MSQSNMAPVAKKKEIFTKLVRDAIALLDQDHDDIIFFKHCDFTYANCNQALVDFSLLNHRKSIVGRIDVELPWAVDSDFYRSVDQQVIRGEHKRILMQVRVANGDFVSVYQTKIPIKDKAGRIIGIMAKMNNANAKISESFITVKTQDFEIHAAFKDLPKKYLIEKYKCYNLTERESECLFYLIRGLTVKAIAKCLQRSPRTVEKFLANLRYKLGCYHRDDLIQRAYQDGILNVIPPTVNLDYITEKLTG